MNHCLLQFNSNEIITPLFGILQMLTLIECERSETLESCSTGRQPMLRWRQSPVSMTFKADKPRSR